MSLRQQSWSFCSALSLIWSFDPSWPHPEIQETHPPQPGRLVLLCVTVKHKLQQCTYPADEPSLQVTDTLFKRCSFMSCSSFCAEHGYRDCARFFTCTMKLSMLLSTAVKSKGKLSGPSIRCCSGVVVCCCCCTRRVWARPPRTRRVSTGALMWMKSISRQERTADSLAELLNPPRLLISSCYRGVCM